jgi:hypothetical protein
MKSTPLWLPTLSSSAAFRKVLYHEMDQVSFWALTMNDGQIRLIRLIITNIIGRTPLGISRGSSPNSIAIVNVMNCVTLSESVVRILDKLQTKWIPISAITRDGARSQVKALDFEVIRQFSQRIARLDIYASYCLFRAYVTAERRLPIHLCGLRSMMAMITSHRDLAARCLKPDERPVLGPFFPMFIQTNEFSTEIAFILKHDDKIAKFTEIPYRDAFHLCEELFGIFLGLVSRLERESPSIPDGSAGGVPTVGSF